MSFTFKPAARENVPLLIGLDGASGSGKTFSALLLAEGIAGAIGRAQGRDGRVFFIDTERGRAKHYADQFNFMHAEVNPPFRPQVYGDAIAAAEQQGADVIVIDSFSHEWEGEGGVRDWAADLENNGQKPPKNWMQPKQAHKRLVNQMLAARAHIIVCLRCEEKMKVEQVDAGNGRKKMQITAATDLPLLERWVAICEKRFPFEITTSALLTPDRPGVPIPRKIQEQHRPFFPDGQRITRKTGEALATWAMGGKMPDAAGPDLDAARAAIEAAIPRGEEALREAWMALPKEARQALAGELDGYKRRAAPPPDPTPAQQPEQEPFDDNVI